MYLDFAKTVDRMLTQISNIVWHWALSYEVSVGSSIQGKDPVEDIEQQEEDREQYPVTLAFQTIRW